MERDRGKKLEEKKGIIKGKRRVRRDSSDGTGNTPFGGSPGRLIGGEEAREWKPERGGGRGGKKIENSCWG